MFRTLLSLCICFFLTVSACQEKGAGGQQGVTEYKTLTAAQDSAYRRQFMFDKSPGAELLPAELIPFIQPPYVALSFEEADLNADGLNDYILVLGNQQTEGAEEIYNYEPAPIYILLRKTDKTLEVHSKNEKALTQQVFSYSPMEDAGIYADTTGNGFHIYSKTHGAGATATFSEASYHFVLDKKSKRFYLSEIVSEDGLVSPEGAREFMLEKARRGEYSYDTVALKQEDFEPEIVTTKMKPGEQWFSDFDLAELDALE